MQIDVEKPDRSCLHLLHLLPPKRHPSCKQPKQRGDASKGRKKKTDHNNTQCTDVVIFKDHCPLHICMCHRTASFSSRPRFSPGSLSRSLSREHGREISHAFLFHAPSNYQTHPLPQRQLTHAHTNTCAAPWASCWLQYWVAVK
jgi:hypothetical protein